LDGLLNTSTDANGLSEQTYFKEYVAQVSGKVTDSKALTAIKNDPAGDDFVHYLSDKFNQTKSVVERYKNFMGLENNSPTTENPTNTTITEANSMMPDREDLNNDNTINEVEAYYEYKVDLKPGQLAVGQGFVVDKVNEGGSIGICFVFR